MNTSRPFFDFWRQRAEFASTLDVRTNYYEANVLVWAALDALAGLWTRCFERAASTGRRRLGDFLVVHGGEVFSRVSLPAFWSAADALPQPSMGAPDLRGRLRSFHGRRVPDVLEQRQVRSVEDDPMSDAVLTDLADVADVIVRGNGKRSLTVRDLVQEARFGEIAYKELRCAVIHEGRPGAGAHGFDFGASSAHGPTYLSALFQVPPTLAFSPTFMAGVIRRCVDAFEVEVNATGRDPVPPAHCCIPLDLDEAD